jgi:hypothetical protein
MKRVSRATAVLLVAMVVAAWPVLAQDPALSGAPADSGNQQSPADSDGANDFDKLAESLDKAKKKIQRPPFEFSRNQVAPFDILPWIKPHQWSTLTLEVRANGNRYEGVLQTATDIAGRPQIPLLDMPRAIIYQRDALLPADQTVSRSLQVMLPAIPRRLLLELNRPGSIRPDLAFEAILQKLEPHQMLVPVLSLDPAAYSAWSKKLATLPASGETGSNEIERQRYYRLVFPMDPSRPNLSPHSLTWTTTSHLIWDGLAPETLSSGEFSQQQALVDWLHWGGQLVVVASGPSSAGLEQSFLAPYLPAIVTGAGDQLEADDLKSMAEAYPPPLTVDKLVDYRVGMAENGPRTGIPPRYQAVDMLDPAPNQPLYIARLEPKEDLGTAVVPLGDAANHILAVERRVGRGRVIMLAVNPNDPTLAKWLGLESLIRRLLLRRPEETWVSGGANPAYALLPGTELSWVRFLSRDLGAEPAGNENDPNEVALPTDLALPRQPVAAWIDTSCELPKRTRDTLERASGITIPGSPFVLRVLIAYIVSLVPLNWLISRFLFRRREVAWLIAPVLALGFAYGVERAAAVDIGFDIACDEIDVVEIQAEYPRAHVSRFTSLYSSGRNEFSIDQPDNPTALALPMRAYQSLRGEEIRSSTFEWSGEPKLGDFLVQPRSLAMFRAEAMVDLGGGIMLEGDASTGKLINGTPLELLDAVLVDVDRNLVSPLGTLAAWPAQNADASSAHIAELASAAWGSSEATTHSATALEKDAWADVPSYLASLRDYRWKYPSEQGELRLVAWAREPMPGLKIAPKVDRHRGVRLVVAHFRFEVPRDNQPPYFSNGPTKSVRADDRNKPAGVIRSALRSP